MRPVRGEWRGKTEFEAVPAAAIAGGCEIGAVVVGERGPKHDAVDDHLDRQGHLQRPWRHTESHQGQSGDGGCDCCCGRCCEDGRHRACRSAGRGGCE